MTFVTNSIYFLAFATPFFSIAAASSRQVRRSANIPFAESPNVVNLEVHSVNAGIGSLFEQQTTIQKKDVADASDDVAQLYPIGESYMVPVKVGTQSFLFTVDTSKADTWVADSYFKCSSAHQAFCEIGSTYTTQSCDDSTQSLSGGHLSDGARYYSTVSGPMMTTDLSVADLKFTQEIGLATYMVWKGGNFSSGVLGLAHSGLTQKYPGTDLSGYDDVACPLNGSTIIYDYRGNAQPCNQIHYDTVSENINSSFTLALARPQRGSSNGGSITFGGVPKSSNSNVNTTGQYVTVPMETLDFLGNDTLSYHVISIDGIQLPLNLNYSAARTTTSSYAWSTGNLGSAGKRDAVRRSRYTSAAKRSTQYTALTGATGDRAQFVISTVEPWSIFPQHIAKAVNQLFEPPAQKHYSPYYGSLYSVNCTTLSSTPSIVLKIGGEDFEMNAEDMIVRQNQLTYDYEIGDYVQKEFCYSGIQEAYVSPAEPDQVAYILGQNFLKNVLITFDMENLEIGLVSRPFYDSSS